MVQLLPFPFFWRKNCTLPSGAKFSPVFPVKRKRSWSAWFARPTVCPTQRRKQYKLKGIGKSFHSDVPWPCSFQLNSQRVLTQCFRGFWRINVCMQVYVQTITQCKYQYSTGGKKGSSTNFVMAGNMPRNLKTARLVALAHIITGVLLFLFGIVDRIHGDFVTGHIFFGVWCGMWMCITGALGISASKRERDGNRNVMAGVFMGFAVTSSVFGGVTIIAYSISIVIYQHESSDIYYAPPSRRTASYYHSEMAITAIILILGIIEFFIGIWAAVLCCYICSCNNCCQTQASQMTSVVYVTGQGVVMEQGGVPVAIPIQQAGGVPGVHPQMVHLPATGGVHVAGQPPMYYVPSTGAGGGQFDAAHGAPGAQGSQAQFVGVGPDGALMGQPGTQMPPPYTADEQIPVKI